MKQPKKTTCHITQNSSKEGKKMIVTVFVFLLMLFPFNMSIVNGQNNTLGNNEVIKGHKKNKWSYTLQAGWATNIDFTLKSTSKDYKFNDNSTGINGKFYSYDSREKITEFEGDQANNYLITVRNLSSGITFTTGILHDKRAQRSNKHDHRFKYKKGGLSPTALVGVQYDFNSQLLKNVSVQLKAGGFLNLNRIDATLTNDENQTKYEASNRYRKFAGGGLVSMAVVSYQYNISEAASICFLVNGTMMNGKALTEANAINESTERVKRGTLSVVYSSISVGPSLGFTIVN